MLVYRMDIQNFHINALSIGSGPVAAVTLCKELIGSGPVAASRRNYLSHN